MARKMFFAVSLIALALMLSGASFATPLQITIGQSTTGVVSVTPVAASFSGVSGSAWLGTSSAGSYSLSNATILTTGYSSGTYSLAANTEVLTFTIGSDTLVGDLSLASFTPFTVPGPFGGPGAVFVGTYTITSATQGFIDAGYPVASVVGVDVNSFKNYISAGEVIPDPVPEPGTFALVGSGLLALSGVLRRKL